MEPIASSGDEGRRPPAPSDAKLLRLEAERRRVEAIGKRHRQRQAKALEKDDHARADRYAALAGRAENAAARCCRRIDLIKAAAARARAIRRVERRLAAERAATPPPTSKRELDREARRLLKRERRQAARRKDLEAASVEADPRTAAGQRDYAVSNAKDRAGKRASIVSYAGVFQRQSDRTQDAIYAVQRFEELWHRANAGLIPEQKLERGYSVSAKPASVAMDRAASLDELARLGAHVGAAGMKRLEARIIHGLSFAWMAQEWGGEAAHMGVLFKSDVAAVAAFYRHA
jgi:hypothetical protein